MSVVARDGMMARRWAWLLVFCLWGGTARAESSAQAYEKARRGYFALKASADKQKFRHNWLRVIASLPLPFIAAWLAMLIGKP